MAIRTERVSAALRGQQFAKVFDDGDFGIGTPDDCRSCLLPACHDVADTLQEIHSIKEELGDLRQRKADLGF